MKMFSFLNNLWKFNLFSFLRSTLITLAETPTSAQQLSISSSSMDLTSLSLRVVLSPGFFPVFDVREDRQVSPVFECESLEAPSPLVFPQVWVFDSRWWSSFFQYSSSPSLLFYSWSDQTFWRVFFLQLSVFTLSALCVCFRVCVSTDWMSAMWPWSTILSRLCLKRYGAAGSQCCTFSMFSSAGCRCTHWVRRVRVHRPALAGCFFAAIFKNVLLK